MDKLSFLQEKSSFHMRYPQQSDLAFYRWFTEQYPREAIGWYHLGREHEARGERELAIAAHKQALHVQPGPFHEEARQAYQNLLRERQKESWRKRSRLLLGSLLFFYLQFVFSPGLLTDPLPPVTPALAASEMAGPTAMDKPHVEVIAVPQTLSIGEMKTQVRRYLQGRRPALEQPYTVMIVPEAFGLPLFTPLLFYQPTEVLGVLRYQPSSRTVLTEQWFEQPVSYQKESALGQAREAFTREQMVFQHIITLRNALYRYYQQKGTLPARLADLAGAYPGNSLPQIPLPPAEWGLPAYPYYPEKWNPALAWDSMPDVLPLPGYPEPVEPLQPLQLHLFQASHRLELRSGTHLIRSHPIGLGKNNATPNGLHTILQKINQPRGHDNIYGTRGLVFLPEGYAIHGTNDPGSIGQDASLGCVRLHNADIEELYSFVSLGTEVVISAMPAGVDWSNPPAFLLEARPEEETPNVVYKWLH